MVRRLARGCYRTVVKDRAEGCNIYFRYNHATQRMAIEERGGYESRNIFTLHLLLAAMRGAKDIFQSGFTAKVVTTDFNAGVPGEPILAYCASPEQTEIILIPDYIFWGWPEVGIVDYEASVGEMLAAGDRPPEDGRLLWIGNVAMHPNRKRFMEIAQEDERIYGVGMNWVPDSYARDTGKLKAQNNTYISLPDHCKYRYLIDIEGRGYSGRLKLLMFSGRLIFIQDRPWREFFFDEMTPFEHFVPVRNDLGDLSEKLDWAEANPAEVSRIGANARQFALNRLRRVHAIEAYRNALLKLSRM